MVILDFIDLIVYIYDHMVNILLRHLNQIAEHRSFGNCF
jgi:hypothetical protein